MGGKGSKQAAKQADGGVNDPFESHNAAARGKQSAGGHHARDAYEKVESLADSRSPTAMLMLSVYMPFGFFVVLMGLFTFGYHRFPVIPWVIAIVGIDIALIGAWPPHKESGHTTWDYLPVFAMLLAVLLGATTGLLNSSNMEPWVHAKHLREYSDVRPDKNPQEYADAGIMHFAPGTSLDVARAAGYKVWPYMYCAAPIVGQVSGTATAPAVGFWAVGMDCCDGLGNFWCDGAKDQTARSGLRLESNAIAESQGHKVTKHLMQAVNKAAATEGIDVADSPILLAWSKDPQGAANVWWWVAFATFIGGSIVALIAASMARVGLRYYLRMTRK